MEALFEAALRLTAPLLLAALGELVVERADGRQYRRVLLVGSG